MTKIQISPRVKGKGREFSGRNDLGREAINRDLGRCYEDTKKPPFGKQAVILKVEPVMGLEPATY